MRYDKVFRFLLFTFVAGSIVGLLAGLLVTGPRAKAASGVQASSTTMTRAAEPGLGSEEPMTAERAKAMGANEMGQVLVLMYHKITKPEDPSALEPEYCRSALHFQEDIALLKAEGYYPITVKDLVTGSIDIPAGKSPVVLTFDDSSQGQYRILDDGTIDPESAVGILMAAGDDGNWPMRASFFPLLDVDLADHVIFGQPERQKDKLQQLVEWGCEVGSHSYTHLNLKTSSREVIIKELALSMKKLEDMVGNGYEVFTLSVPFGEYPEDESLLATGEYEGFTYTYHAALAVTGGPSDSPFSTKFDPMHVRRIEVYGDSLKQAINASKKSPELRYISDGDPAVISAPADLPEKLGSLLPDLGRPVITY